MHFFQYRNNQLCCEAVPLTKIAHKVGTPCYVYSYRTLMRHFDVFDKAFKDSPHFICFAMKANSNLAILRAIAERGGGVDIVTGGELFRSVTARVPPKKIVYSGVGKSNDEIAAALRIGILMFNVESAEELQTIDRIAGKMRKKAPVSLRVNPDIDPKTHPYVATGLRQSKFGIQVDAAMKLYKEALYFKHISLCGISCHIGSQITKIDPFIQAVKRVAKMVPLLRKQGIAIEYIDIGGGLGISYRNEKPPEPAAYGKALNRLLRDLDVTVILEPGRVLVGNAGILVTKVLYNKAQGKKKFVVVDGAMNDLMRPSLYGSYHEIQPVRKQVARKHRVDVVGPICESGDYLATDRSLPSVQAGDLLAVMSAGAYGFTMSSNYNSRPRVPEVLVHGKKYFVIRKRETYKDLLQGEQVPRFLL